MSGGDWKAMFKAVQDNDLELVKFYINTGIDLNYQHPEYLALALCESIRYQHLEMTKILLKNGADASIVEMESNKTALALAQSRNEKAVVALLQQFD